MFAKFIVPKGALYGYSRNNLKALKCGRTIWIDVADCVSMELRETSIIFFRDYTTLVFASAEEAQNVAQSIEDAWTAGRKLCCIDAEVNTVIR